MTEVLPLLSPYDVAWMQWYLEAHQVYGAERVDGKRYSRALALRGGPGVVALDWLDGRVEMHSWLSDDADLDEAVAVVRRLLDLDTDGAAADRSLARDPALAIVVLDAPGLRVPGVVDGWELLLRTMIGQQISLAAARTHLARLVARLGETVSLDTPGLSPLPDAILGGEVTVAREWRLMPTAEAVAAQGGEV